MTKINLHYAEGFSSHLKKNTQCASMRKTNRERLNEEKSAVLCENCTKEPNTLCGRHAEFTGMSQLLRRGRIIRSAIISVVGGSENRKVPQLVNFTRQGIWLYAVGRHCERFGW
jgi:hypothetical protein